MNPSCEGGLIVAESAILVEDDEFSTVKKVEGLSKRLQVGMVVYRRGRHSGEGRAEVAGSSGKQM
jgi:hypothetical protein